MKNPLGVLAICAAMMAAVPALASEPEDNKTDPRLGEPVSRICFAGTIRNWRSIDGDDAILLGRTMRDWYRVELSAPCRERDFRHALSIGLETRPGGGCVSRGDVIIVRAPGEFTNRCIITKMNRWDNDAAAPEEEDGGEVDAT